MTLTSDDVRKRCDKAATPFALSLLDYAVIDILADLADKVAFAETRIDAEHHVSMTAYDCADKHLEQALGRIKALEQKQGTATVNVVRRKFFCRACHHWYNRDEHMSCPHCGAPGPLGG